MLKPTTIPPEFVSLGADRRGQSDRVRSSKAVNSIRNLLRAGGAQNLIRAHVLIRALPSDFPHGWSLVRHLFQAASEGVCRGSIST